MYGSLQRISIVSRKLLRQNRILLACLLLWPCILSLILLIASHGAPAAEDIAAILEQELFYGLVLVGLGGNAALGTEQRAHRVQQVLGRAVGRTEYLLALAAQAYLPFAGYVVMWLLNAEGFAAWRHLQTPMLLPPVIAELAAGLLLCAIGTLFSVVLAQMLAAIATGVMLASLLAAGTHGWSGIPQLFGVVVGNIASSSAPALVPWSGAVEALASTLVLVAIAATLFAHKDLKVM